MKLLLLCLCVAAANAGLASLHMAKARGIPNSFIIRVKDASMLDQVEKDVLGQFQTMRVASPKVSKISDLLPILTLRIPPHLINTIRSIDGIEYIEQDAFGELYGQQYNPTWGIDRIDSRNGIDYVYNFNDNVQGDGVKIYIVDTGIRMSHSEFGGRVQHIYGGEDDQGHGTHCAGTSAGSTYGIARKATIYSAKVCDMYGRCPTSTLFQGLNAVSSYGRGVVSMSLGFPASSTIDDAVQKLLDAGYVVSVAAGNSNSDSCYISPARIPGGICGADTSYAQGLTVSNCLLTVTGVATVGEKVITVAASDRYDQRASFSCWGSCVDLFAPGVNVESAGLNNDHVSATMSGTSMACPHVTGAAALYLGMNPSSWNVKQDLLADATPGKIYDTAGTPNKLLYIGNL